MFQRKSKLSLSFIDRVSRFAAFSIRIKHFFSVENQFAFFLIFFSFFNTISQQLRNVSLLVQSNLTRHHAHLSYLRSNTNPTTACPPDDKTQCKQRISTAPKSNQEWRAFDFNFGIFPQSTSCDVVSSAGRIAIEVHPWTRSGPKVTTISISALSRALVKTTNHLVFLCVCLCVPVNVRAGIYTPSSRISLQRDWLFFQWSSDTIAPCSESDQKGRRCVRSESLCAVSLLGAVHYQCPK